MAKNPNKNPMRTFYRRPTHAATKAEEAKQNGRILRFRAKLLKQANEKMKKMIAEEKAKMTKFKKGKPVRARRNPNLLPLVTPGAAKRKAMPKRSSKKSGLGFRFADDLLSGIF